MPWYYDPHSGGGKIPPHMQETIRLRVKAYEVQRPWYPQTKLTVRFRGQFCYVDSIESDGTQMPLGRLRYFSENDWSFAYFTYSTDQYRSCLISSASGDKHTGTIEEALAVCECQIC